MKKSTYSTWSQRVNGERRWGINVRRYGTLYTEGPHDGWDTRSARDEELRRLRGELHERERLLDKRQDALEEQAEVLRKQEKMVESTQRKLTERKP